MMVYNFLMDLILYNLVIKQQIIVIKYILELLVYKFILFSQILHVKMVHIIILLLICTLIREFDFLLIFQKL